MTYVIRGSRSWSHQEPHPSKQAGANIPPTIGIRPRTRAMGQGYPLTGPSPGVDHPIYPSSLPLTCGNLFSNIFPKSHGFFCLLPPTKSNLGSLRNLSSRGLAQVRYFWCIISDLSRNRGIFVVPNPLFPFNTTELLTTSTFRDPLDSFPVTLPVDTSSVQCH